MYRKDLLLTDLVNLEEWQKMQDSLSDALGVTLRTISGDGEVLTAPSHPSRLCTDILPKVLRLNPFCASGALKKTDKKFLLKVRKETRIECPFGLDAFLAPITAIGSKVVAYIVVGPLILKSRKEESEYVNEAKKMGMSPDDIMDAIIEINVFSHSEVYAIIKLINDIFSHVARTGYHKKRLGEIAPEVIELDPIFSRYYEEKILKSLLQACLLTLSADSGSVMIRDKETDMLHIRVSSKLEKKIVKNTEVKMGEGIAGMAAAMAQPIILPKDKNKKGISEQMKRSYIRSSMIVPFNKGDAQDIYGVLNLNILRKKLDFSEKDIAIVKELVNMTSVALMSVQQAVSL